jgi:hypothetical protein
MLIIFLQKIYLKLFYKKEGSSELNYLRDYFIKLWKQIKMESKEARIK